MASLQDLSAKAEQYKKLKATRQARLNDRVSKLADALRGFGPSLVGTSSQHGPSGLTITATAQGFTAQGGPLTAEVALNQVPEDLLDDVLEALPGFVDALDTAAADLIGRMQ